MRVAIYDGILESHLALSLERALIRRGHEVHNTGRIGSGFTFPDDVETIRRLNIALDQVLDFSPDVILVFRPASMPFSLLKRAKASKALLMAWFSDDPVLWNLSYGPVVDFYDVILHCGNSQVLQFYEKQHGRPTGINFPFWTDNESFPYVFGQNRIDAEAMFLGNVRGQVRRQRYLDLAELVSDVKIYGSVDEDTHNIWGGYLDSNAEVADAASRSLIGLNIPQFFSDHEGMPTWFDGLGDLTFFQYPSRVIQYAAMGLPIISMVPDSKYMETFPEILCVKNPEELDRAIRLLVDETDLNDLSRRTHERFRQNYSSDARAIAIEALVEHDVDWRSMSVERRTSLYLTYEALPEKVSVDKGISLNEIPSTNIDQASGHCSLQDRLRRHTESLPKRDRSLDIAVTGTGWSSDLSDVSITVRALRALGHNVKEWNPYRLPDCFVENLEGESKLRLNIGPSLMADGRYPKVIVFVGDWVSIRPLDAIALDNAGCILLHIAAGAKSAGPEEQKTASLMTYTTVLDPAAVESFNQFGFSDVSHLPKLVDRAFLSALRLAPVRAGQVGFLATRAADFEFYESFVSAFDAANVSTFALREDGGNHGSLGALAAVCRSERVISFPESKSKTSNVNPMLGFSLMSGALPVTLRRSNGPIPGITDQYFVSVRDKNEMLYKLRRAVSGAEWVEKVISQALDIGFDFFSAEEQLSRILAKALQDR